MDPHDSPPPPPPAPQPAPPRTTHPRSSAPPPAPLNRPRIALCILLILALITLRESAAWCPFCIITPGRMTLSHDRGAFTLSWLDRARSAAVQADWADLDAYLMTRWFDQRPAGTWRDWTWFGFEAGQGALLPAKDASHITIPEMPLILLVAAAAGIWRRREWGVFFASLLASPKALWLVLTAILTLLLCGSWRPAYWGIVGPKQLGPWIVWNQLGMTDLYRPQDFPTTQESQDCHDALKSEDATPYGGSGADVSAFAFSPVNDRGTRWLPRFERSKWEIGRVQHLAVPDWLPALAIASLLAIPLAHWLKRYPRGHCRHCGYNLRGNTSGVCPECGRKQETPPAPTPPAIPSLESTSPNR